MHRLEEAMRDMSRALELGDIKAAEEYLGYVIDEGQGVEQAKLTTELIAAMSRRDFLGAHAIVTSMIVKAVRIDLTAGVWFGQGFRDVADAVDLANLVAAGSMN